MSRDDDTRFEPRLSRPRSGGEGRTSRPPTSFKQQVLRAVARAGRNPRLIGKAMAGRAGTRARTGRFNARGRGSKLVATFPRESGWSRPEGGMRYRARRVVVKARVVKMHGSGSKAAYAHLRYLQRDGATLDGERGRLYSASLDEAGAAEETQQLRQAAGQARAQDPLLQRPVFRGRRIAGRRRHGRCRPDPAGGRRPAAAPRASAEKRCPTRQRIAPLPRKVIAPS